MDPLNYADFDITGAGTNSPDVWVTNLQDDWRNPQPGSFRYVANNLQPGTTIKFAVGGVIDMNDKLTISNVDNITIAGETAPLPGIFFKNGTIIFANAKNYIIRHIRSRPSDEVHLKKGRWATEEWGSSPTPPSSLTTKGPTDSMTIKKNCRKFLIHNCSFQWSHDEAISVVDSKKIYIMRCLIAEPIANKNIHSDGVEHAYGSILSGNNIEVGQSVYAFCQKRSPRLIGQLKDDAKVSAYSNYIHCYDTFATQIVGHKQETINNGRYMVVNNYYSGISNSEPIRDIILEEEKLEPGTEIYIKGNISLNRTSQSQPEWKLVGTKEGVPADEDKYGVDSQLFDTKGEIVNVNTVKNEVIDACGALPADAIDTRIKNNIKNGLQYFLHSQDDVSCPI